MLFCRVTTEFVCILSKLSHERELYSSPSSSDGLLICHLPYGPTASFSLTHTVMRHDIPNVGTMSEAAPHLIFHNFNTKLGGRVGLTALIMAHCV